MRRAVMTLSLLAVALPARAERIALSLDRVFETSDLVVLGTLDPGIRVSGAEGSKQKTSLHEGDLKVTETLWGRAPGKTLALRWKVRMDVRLEADAVFDPATQAGMPRIWCLKRNADGSVSADHPDRVLPPEKRPEVEKAIQARLARLRKTIEDSKSLSGGPVDHIEITPVDSQACLDLAQAGPVALPLCRDLLKHPKAVQRAWGCRLAGLLRERALAGDLVFLLDDSEKLTVFRGIAAPSTVGEQALEALGEIAGKPFASKEEARFWVKGREDASVVARFTIWTRTPASPDTTAHVVCHEDGSVEFTGPGKRRGSAKLKAEQTAELRSWTRTLAPFSDACTPPTSSHTEPRYAFEGKGSAQASWEDRTNILRFLYGIGVLGGLQEAKPSATPSSP